MEIKLEDSLKRLSEIVQSLESSETPLEEAMKLFEEGVSLARGCHGKLSEVEKRIEILTKVGPEGVESKPYQPR